MRPNQTAPKVSTRWTAPADKKAGQELINYALFGPSIDLPKGCKPNQWRWMNQTDGLAVCADGRAFAVLNGTVMAAGKIPRSCGLLNKAARHGTELVVGCSKDGRLIAFANGAWSTLPGPKDVFALAADEQCVIAASRYVVWRKCRESEAAAAAH